MKIGMITSSYPRFEGDIAGTFVRSLAEEVTRLGHEVHVFAGYDPAQQEPASPVQVHRFRYAPLKTWHCVGYGQSLESDVALRKGNWPLLPLYATAAVASMLRWNARVRFDLIHAHWVVPGGGIGDVVSRLTGAPLVISLHGSDVFMLEKNAVARWVARTAFGRARYVTGCSSDLLERAQRHGLSPARSRLIPYGVDTARFRPDRAMGLEQKGKLGIPESAPVVLALGRLVYKKGFEYLVRAMPRLLEQWPDLRVVIAGGGALEDELRGLARDLGVESHLLLPGSVPWEETVRYLNMADVFVVPSVHDQQGNVDGLPNTALEAMACGKPLVASRVAGIPEVVRDGENGLLVGEKDPVQLAAAILQLLASPEMAARMGQANRNKLEQELTWHSIARRFVEVYEQALAAAH